MEVLLLVLAVGFVVSLTLAGIVFFKILGGPAGFRRGLRALRQ